MAVAVRPGSRTRRFLRRAAGAAAGGAGGFLAGAAVTLGLVVARAQLLGLFIESTDDILGPLVVPVALGVLGGLAAGGAGARILKPLVARMLVGLVAGAGAGAVVGAAASPHPTGPWAGGVMGAAAGALIGVGVGVVVVLRRVPGEGGRSRRAAGAMAPAGLLLCVAGCAAPEPDHPERVVAVSEDESPAESVVYLVGDPGEARYDRHPILERLRRDVEAWSERLPTDSAAVVLVLGDAVYPDGMREPDHAEFPRDSAIVADQLRVVTSERASGAGARMLYLAGNHDWGLRGDREGARRLANLGRFLDRRRGRGVNAALVPTAGTGGPYVVDLGRHLRLVLLDTSWWAFGGAPREREETVRGLARALATAGDRQVVLAAHHPFESGGPHGGRIQFWPTAGIKYLMNRSGALLQGLSSPPYAELRAALREVFRMHGRPLAFAGGHEHSLQLIRLDSATAPRYSLVSGSASRLSTVAAMRGTMMQAAEPGYMRLVVRENGAVDLFVVAAPAEFRACEQSDAEAAERERCLAEGVAAFRTIFSTRLAAAP